MSVVIGNVLRYGVVLSALFIVIGMLRLGQASGFSETSSLLVYNPNAIPHGIFSVSLAGLLNGLASLDSFSLIELGVIILIATPVSRVITSVFLLAAEGDRPYVFITSVVLALLLFSMLVTPFIPGFRA